MEIIEIADTCGKKDFSVKKIIKVDDKHYVEIQPDQKAYRIRISQADYRAALRAYHSSQSINCYPLQGEPEDGIFEDAVYELTIK